MLGDLDAAQAALTGFAYGYSKTGAAPSVRGDAGGQAAVAASLEMCLLRPNLTVPDVLEATLHLGHLEGTWQKVYQRRERLITAQIKPVSEAWHTLGTPEIVDQVAKAGQDMAATLGIGETASDVLKKLRSALYRAMAAVAELVGWGALRESLVEAVKVGQAEGAAAAIAIGADQAGELGAFEWDLAFGHALDALRDTNDLIGGIANSWLDALLTRAAFDLGPVLATLIEQRADYDAITAAVQGAFALDSAAAAFTTDWLVTRGLSDGALALYASEGVQLVSFITAGDDRVCPWCESAEANGPYAPDACPKPGHHPLCRCTLAAALNPSTFLPYIR